MENPAALTEGGPRLGPADGGDDDEAEAFVLPAADLHVVGLHHGADHPAAAAAAAADAAGAAAARADCVERVLAALRRPLLLRQRGRLVAAVVGGGRRWDFILRLGDWGWGEKKGLLEQAELFRAAVY